MNEAEKAPVKETNFHQIKILSEKTNITRALNLKYDAKIAV